MITKFNIFLTTLADTLSTHSVSADAARPWQLMFQDPATPIAEGVMDFHNDLMFVVVFVGIFVRICNKYLHLTFESMLCKCQRLKWLIK